MREGFFERRIIDAPKPAEARLEKALDYLQAGENEAARKILEKLLQEGDTFQLRPVAAFYLGVIKVFEMDDLLGMEACKNYFQAYVEQYPTQPYTTNAAGVVRLLDKYIELARVVQEQAQEIKTLRYQIQKLEEIQQETERKRQSFEIR